MTQKQCSKLELLLKISYTGQYILNRKTQFQTIFGKECSKKYSKRQQSSRLIHFCFALLLDIVLGIVVTSLLHHELRPRRLAENALLCTDLVVSNLRR